MEKKVNIEKKSGWRKDIMNDENAAQRIIKAGKRRFVNIYLKSLNK